MTRGLYIGKYSPHLGEKTLKGEEKERKCKTKRKKGERKRKKGERSKEIKG
jgi:hypothetical protein